MNDYNMQSMEFDTDIMKDIEKQRIIEQLEECSYNKFHKKRWYYSQNESDIE